MRGARTSVALGTVPSPGGRSSRMAKKGQRNNRLRIERRRRGWTQNKLVDVMYEITRDRKLPEPTGLDANYISRYERGVNEPSPHHVHLMCLAFELRSDQLGLPGGAAPSPASSGEPPAELREAADTQMIRKSAAATAAERRMVSAMTGSAPNDPDDVKRREFIERGLVAVGGAVAHARVEWERLTHTTELSVAVDDRLVDDFDTLTLSYGQLRDGVSPAMLVMPVIDHRNMLMDALPRTKSSAHTSRVQRAAAQTAIIAGWLSFNLRQFGQALSHWTLAQALAQEAGDAALHSYAVGCQTRLHSRVHRGGQSVNPRTAVNLFDRAIELTSNATNPALRSWLLVNRAEQFADLGDARSCYCDIEAAVRVIGSLGPTDDVLWSRWTIARLDGYRGNCERLLRRPAEAIVIMEDSLKHIDARFPGRALQLSDLAAAYAEKREVEEACRLLADSFATARAAGFSEGLLRISEVRAAKLSDWKDAAAVRQLDDQLDAVD